MVAWGANAVRLGCDWSSIGNRKGETLWKQALGRQFGFGFDHHAQATSVDRKQPWKSDAAWVMHIA